MKKRIFALALALCMMVSVMPNSFAAGILSVGDGTSTDTTVPSGGSILSVGGNTSTQLNNTGALQNSILSNGSSAQPLDDGTGETGEEPTGDENTGTTPTAPAASNSEKLDNGGGSYAGPSLAKEDYTLSNSATAVGAADMEPKDPKPNDDITVGKKIVDNGNGTYTITLEASTKSSMATVSAPGNIVLVLDASESMQNIATINGETKTNAAWLEGSVKDFLDDAPAGSNVAIVGYGDTAHCHTDTDLAKALLPIDTKLGDLKSAAEAVHNATINGTYNNKHGKYADLGLKMAVQILQKVTNDLPAVVILFTDGAPTNDVKSSSLAGGFSIAQDALHWATILKADKTGDAKLNESDEFYQSGTSDMSDYAGMLKGCGATVYCVAVNLPNRNINTQCGNHPRYGENPCYRCMTNEFLYRASSVRKDSSDVGSYSWWYNYTDARTHNTKYYLVGDIANVGDMFGQIEVENGVSLGDVTVKDVLPAYMDVVDSNGGTSTTDPATGKTTVSWADKLDPQNPVSQTLTVKFKEGFLGGHSVPTNDGTSGIYVGTAMAAEFGIPTVNVPVPEISTVTAVDKNIYLGKELSDAELLEGVKATYDVVTKDNDGKEITKTFTIDPTKPNFGLKSWQTAYTKSIVFSVVNDAKFTLGCTITPNAAQTTIYQPVSKTDDATITVFKPHIDFKDSTIYLGNWAYFEDNHESSCVSWLNASGVAANNMIGAAPSVSVVYSVDQENDGKLTDCTPVNVVKVTLGADTATNYLSATTFNADKHLGSEDKNEFTVHIVAPSVAFQDSTIYLGHTPNKVEYEAKNVVKESGKDKITWTHIGSDGTATNRVGEPTNVTYTFEPTKDFTTCTPVDVTVKAGNLTCETVEDAFEVHVTKPVITSAGTTIYLGNTVNLKSQMDESDYWYCDHTGDDEEKLAVMDGSTRLAPSIDHSFTVPEGADPITDETKYLTNNCVDVTVSATVNGKPAPIENAYQRFTVHVIQPTITFADQDIYLSQTPVYAAPAFAWDATCADGCEGMLPENNSTDTEDMFSYSYDVDPGKFVQCTAVNVTVKIGTTDYTEYVTLKNTDGTTRNIDKTDEIDELEHEFTVHVYLPQVVLDSQNLWADYDCDVTLTDGMKDAVISEWSNQCNSNEKKDHSSNAPQCSDPVYVFTLNGNVITTYNAKDEEVTDQSTIDVALDKIKIGGIEYEFSNVAAVAYTITVNKFDLTISKEWKDGEKAADGPYKQDAIFTVAHGQDTFKVVLPADQSNVKVTGLLCGQDYTVTEDTNWTWRWKATKDISFTTHGHDVSTSAPTEHVNPNKTNEQDTTNVSFTNKLIEKLGELWLSFCTTVKNIFAAVTTTEGGN